MFVYNPLSYFLFSLSLSSPPSLSLFSSSLLSPSPFLLPSSHLSFQFALLSLFLSLSPLSSSILSCPFFFLLPIISPFYFLSLSSVSHLSSLSPLPSSHSSPLSPLSFFYPFLSTTSFFTFSSLYPTSLFTLHLFLTPLFLFPLVVCRLQDSNGNNKSARVGLNQKLFAQYHQEKRVTVYQKNFTIVN